MRERDKAIVSDLERFRCLSRDDIAYLHFSTVKNPIKEANAVLKRLRRDGIISVSKERRIYLYFPIPSIKKDSAKIGHFLAIADFYKQLRLLDQPERFEVEPKLGPQGFPEPDAFVIWRKTPFFVEIQNNVFTDKQMQAKLHRYDSYYLTGGWEKAEWQPKDKKPIFPYIWIVGKGRYNVGIRSFRVLQGSVEEVLQNK